MDNITNYDQFLSPFNSDLSAVVNRTNRIGELATTRRRSSRFMPF